MRGSRERHGSLPDATRADDGHKTLPAQWVRDGIHALGTANDPRQRRRQSGRSVGNRCFGDGKVECFVDPGYRRDEAIAPAGHRINVLLSGAFVSKQLAQRCDVNP